MKKFFALGLAVLTLASAADAQVRVRGYTRSDGTYVQPHFRSSPDSSRLNNYSTQGNVNPYTGQLGTRSPYSSSSSGYNSYSPRSSGYGPYTGDSGYDYDPN